MVFPMKISLITLMLIFSSNFTFAAEIYPSLLVVKIGEVFDHPQWAERKDNNRPTTQFRVPNYGKTKTLFSEYSVAILNSTNHVSIVTAEAVLADINECSDKKKLILNWVKDKFPSHISIPREKSHLDGDNEYGAANTNMYYVINCQASYGPFWSIHFQMRGTVEDQSLNAAWSKFLN